MEWINKMESQIYSLNNVIILNFFVNSCVWYYPRLNKRKKFLHHNYLRYDIISHSQESEETHKTSVSIAVVRADIWTRDLPNAKHEF
jgi:hypothetical protein